VRVLLVAMLSPGVPSVTENFTLASHFLPTNIPHF